MMYKVIVEKQCGCFKRSGYEPEVSFENKDEALLHANERKEDMNETFCGKHNFFVLEENNSFIIKMGE